MPKVLNNRTDKIPLDAVYVGRPSKWGNPFQLIAETFRHDVVIQYKEYLLKNKKLMNDLHELRGKDLVCWCAPRECHADVLLKLANKETF